MKTGRAAVKPYNLLAKYYDQVFTFHQPWAEAARKALLAPILRRIGSACDLACGTGTTALKLARKGIRVFAVDLSFAMCSVTRKKVREAGLSVTVIHSDMRRFKVPEPVDLVLCEFDALNHLPRKEDLSRVTRAVTRALRPGGYFYFDVNNRLGFQSYWKGAVRVEKPQFLLFLSNGNDARPDRAWCDCDWFLPEGRLWRRHQERVEEVCWTAAEIRHALKGSGFDRIHACDSAPFFKGNHLITPGCRTHYLARKAK